MDLKDKMREEEAQRIVHMGNILVLNIIEDYKDFLKDNNFVFEGKVANLPWYDDGPKLEITEDFSNWLLKNAAILKEDCELILLIRENKSGSSGNKRKTSRTRKRRGKNIRDEEQPED